MSKLLIISTRPKLLKPYYFVLVFSVFQFVAECRNFNVHDRVVQVPCIVILGRTNQVYENVVSQGKALSYTFHVAKEYIQKSHSTKLRVEVGTTSTTSVRYPILFSVQQQRYINSLEVPRAFTVDDMDTGLASEEKSKQIFYTAARTLCIEGTYISDQDRKGRNITVRVTTQSRDPLQFYLILRLSEDFQIPIGKELTFGVSPTTPKFFGFSFSRPDMKQVKIKATSQNTTCMTISVQSVQCPIYDSVHNVRYKGLWQTMSTTAAMTVQKMGWYENGFVLVFVVHTDPKMCGRQEDIYGTNETRPASSFHFDEYPIMHSAKRWDPREKLVHLLITNESVISPGIILLCLLLPIGVTLLISFAVLLLFRNRHEWMAQILKEKFSSTLLSSQNGNSSRIQNGNTVDDSEDEQHNPPRSVRVRPSSTSQVNGSIPQFQSCIKWKSDLFISNFKCKTFEEVEKFSKRFYWTIAIVAIFYSIPVYQLVVHYLRVLYRTGEYDICYYNYLCAQRLGVLIDFNHFWSNASYIIFGILYIAIVRQRSLNMCLPHRLKQKYKDSEHAERGKCTCCPTNKNGKAICLCGCSFTKVCYSWDHGVPGHFGVFYALGVALTMEGFLSAAYHLCPNQSTFQFDTCFMYVIAVLLLLKIYQFRHPVHFGANQTFAILAGFVVTSVLGLLFERGTKKAALIFKIIFITLQYIVMTLLCIYYYAVGYIKNEAGEKITDMTIFRNLGQLRSQRINGDRLILPLITFSICIAVLVYSQLSNMEFASYLLYILVGNVLGMTFYYVGIMKPLHGEFKNRTWVQPALYFLAAGVIGGLSMQYFVRAPAQWELSASASRTKNEDCLNTWFPFHPFYDSHDAWHFLSAASLFLAFMGLLIVDDDLITTPQTKIHVF